MSGSFYIPVVSVGLAIGDGVRGARILMNRYSFRYLLGVRAFLFKLRDDNYVVILKQKYRKLRLTV